jgi:hypothetical protein
MNWGYKILVVYAVFVAGISFLVYKSSGQKMDLVTTDYYAKELKYQERIDASNRVNSLSAPVEYEIKNGSITILFPKDFSGKHLTGDVVLYCPSNEDKDVKQDFSIQGTSLSMPFPVADKGRYELQLNWKADNVSYYLEENIML